MCSIVFYILIFKFLKRSLEDKSVWYLIIYCNIFNVIFQNKFGYACKICDGLRFEGDLKNLIDDSAEFIRTFLQNVFTSAVWS